MNAAGGRRGSDSPLVRSLRSAVGRESTTFGFSILVTVTFGMVQSVHGAPRTLQIFVYAIGAVMSFTILEGLLSGGFRRPMPQHATQTMALGTSLNVLRGHRPGRGMGDLRAHARPRRLGARAPGSRLVYLLLESLEEALAERLLVASGDDDAAEVSNQDS